jgi:hypothetical protein
MQEAFRAFHRHNGARPVDAGQALRQARHDSLADRQRQGEHSEACDLVLDLEGLKSRMAGLIAVRSKEPGNDYRENAILPMHHVIAVGPVSRGDFNRMLGLGERMGRTVIAQLLKDGLLVSDTPKGELRIGLPLDALNILMPNLYPERPHRWWTKKGVAGTR